MGYRSALTFGISLVIPVAAAASPLWSQTNVAQGKAAAQSSTYPGGHAWKAVDGNTNGNWSSGSVSHTGYAWYAWWYVDLGGIYSISQIQVWNRTDCCSDRLFPFRLAIQNTLDVALNATGDVWREDRDLNSSANPQIFNPGGASGRFVKVQLKTVDYLQLAEVQVYGVPSTGVVPEPMSMALLGTGLAGLGALRRRRPRSGNG